MNIFYLHDDPKACAMAHANKHVIKMIIEYAQLLCTAHHLGDAVLTTDERERLYRLTHQNHPCAVWVRGASSHYDWLYRLFVALCDEYTHRYGRVHLTDSKLRHVLNQCPITTDLPFVSPPQVMPSEYQKADTIEAYRAYYRHGKAEILAYQHRLPPDWLTNLD